MRTSTVLLSVLLLGAALVVWLLWPHDPPPSPKGKAGPATVGETVAPPAPLPALGGEGPDRADPARVAPLDAIDHAPARLALRAALAAEGERRLVVDVAALRSTAPGQAVMRCLTRQAGDELDRMRERSGFQPLEQVDEMAVVDGVAIARGRLADVQWIKLNPHDEEIEPEPYGEKGRLYLRGSRGIATWGDEVLLGDGDREQLTAAIDRIEGRVPVDQVPPLNGTSGLLPAEDIFEVLPVDYEVRQALESYLEDHPTGLGFAVQASDAGVQVTLRFNGDDETVTMLTTALEAVKEGGLRPGEREKLAPLVKALELERIEGGLEARLFAPLPLLLEIMGECATEEAH